MPKEAKNKNNKVKESKTKRHFFKDVKAELKKVIWPTKKQLVNNTVAVISIVLIVGIAVKMGTSTSIVWKLEQPFVMDAALWGYISPLVGNVIRET